mmetsp:Transcript_11222/g.35755  ORF Transcript_11222/g.35755 Transcript_11222/m.35755 type:complete len:156 (-) Transcript_11222:395-862(-)
MGGVTSVDLCAPTNEMEDTQTEEDCIDDKQEPSKPDASPAREPPVEAKLDTFQDFKAKFAHGLTLIKFGRNSVAKRRVFVFDARSETFTWKVPSEAPKRSRFAPAKIPVYKITDILKVRTALEPDPKVPTFGGTEVLRRGLNPLISCVITRPCDA